MSVTRANIPGRPGVFTPYAGGLVRYREILCGFRCQGL
jgi:hypothetical protein